jgi:hypothetical protein
LVLLEPEPPLLATWVRRLEDQLGVNDAHRRALEFSAIEVIAAIRIDQEERGLRGVGLDGRTELPDAERGRAADDIRQLDRLNRRLVANARQHLELSPLDRAAEAEVAAGIAESMALATVRGEEVATTTGGVKQLLERDPLLRLASANHITPKHLETGRELVDLYEARCSDLGAIEYGGTPGGAHNNDRYVDSRLKRAKASEMLGRVERAVAINCSAEPACLTMLRVVCERGMSVTSQGKGRAFERNVAALIRALEVAEPVLRRQA